MTLRQTLSLVIALIAILGSAMGTARAAEDALSAEQQKAVERIVEQYIDNNPELLLRALDKFRANEENTKAEMASANLARLAGDLHNNPASPTTGNPDGDVTIVEFFDYQCGYCKRVFPTIMTLLKEDTDIRYVFKEFPILGPVSVVASRAALAVWQMAPTKYMAFHSAMMTSKGQLSEPKIFAMAANVGIDLAELKQAMEGPAVAAEVEKNMQMAQQLNITGTPSFVIGNHLVPGAIDMNALKQLVAAARKG